MPILSFILGIILDALYAIQSFPAGVGLVVYHPLAQVRYL